MELEYKIFERDIDMLLMRMFKEEHKVCNLFYEKIGVAGKDIVITKLTQSAHHQFGESDLRIDFTVNDEKCVMLIEDKIDAPAQKNQCKRYEKYRDKIRSTENIKKIFIILVAPREYIASEQAEAYRKGKHIIIEYEEIQNRFADNSFEKDMIEQARKKKGKEKVADAQVTAYWQEYRKYCAAYNERKNTRLELINTVDERTETDIWWNYRTSIKETNIAHKTNHGNVDFEFYKQADNIDVLKRVLEPLVSQANEGHERKMHWVRTGKGASLRIDGLPILPLHEDFNAEEHEIEYIMDQISRMNELAIKIRDIMTLFSK